MRKFFPAILLAACLHHASADTITLKNGEKYVGKIINQTDAEVTLAVQVSASIKDERTFKQEEIAKVEKEAPDEVAFQDLKTLQPDPQNSYALETYDRILAVLQNYQNSYPQSARHAAVQASIDAFEQEKAHIVAGEVKYLGQWISKDQAEKRKIQIQAQQFLGTMRQQAASGDIPGALNTFDLFEKSYANTRSYPDAIDLARQLLPRLQQALIARAQTIVYEQEQFQKQLGFSREPQKSELIAAEKREQAGYDAALDVATKSGAKWVPFIPRSAKSVDALQKTATAEALRLATLPVAKMRQSIANVDEARTALANKDLKTAEELLKNAGQLWAANEAVTYWTQQVTAAKIEAATTPTPAPSATPAGSATPKHVSASPPSAARASPAAAAAAEESGSFFMTIPGALTIIGVIIAVAGIGTIINKRKAKNTEA